MLTERLKMKTTNISNRKVLALRKFFVKNSVNKALHYFNRWKDKVEY